MLTTLDKYIIKKFLSSFFFTVLIFTLISVVIDFSEKVEKFIEEPITKEEIIFQYYPNFIIFIDGLLWPLFTLIAVIFFTSRMAYNSEIISIFNAGVSFKRLMRPYLLSASFLAFLYLIGSHYFIPKGNKTRLDLEHKYFAQTNDKGRTNDVHMFVGPQTKVYVNRYNKRDSSIRNFRLEQFDGNQLVYLLKAGSADFLGEPGKWRLRNYEIRTFNGQQETLTLGRGEQMDTTINLFPEDFVDFIEQQTMMTTAQLRAYIKKQKSRGVGNLEKYLVELYRRTAEPFTIFILTIIGVSVAARKVRGGMGLHLAIGIGIGALYIFLSRFAIVFANGQALSPLVGIWLPNIIFTSVAVLLVLRAQK